jgi:iron complex transport system substrate-binding protein
LVVLHHKISSRKDDSSETIRQLGQTCGANARADELHNEIARRCQAVEQAVEGRQRPRILLCIGRDTGSGQLAAIYVAGRNGFYDQIITMAGGTNAYQDDQIPYPQVSAEGVVHLNPDVIIDLVSHINPNDKTPQEIERQWDQLRTVPAVREGRVHVIVGHHALRPGPRYVELLEQLAGLLHPDAVTAGVANE